METYSYLLGFIPASLFGMMVFFAAIGIVIRLLGDAVRRDQNSKSTPEAFKYAFLFKDNWKTIVLTALLVLVSLRFAGSFFEKQFTVEQLATNSGKEKWLFGALCIGFLYNHLAQYLKKKTNFLKVERKKTE